MEFCFAAKHVTSSYDVMTGYRRVYPARLYPADDLDMSRIYLSFLLK
jgi:hypothetical protein